MVTALLSSHKSDSSIYSYSNVVSGNKITKKVFLTSLCLALDFVSGSTWNSELKEGEKKCDLLKVLPWIVNCPQSYFSYFKAKMISVKTPDRFPKKQNVTWRKSVKCLKWTLHIFDYKIFFNIPYLGIFLYDLAVLFQWHHKARFQKAVVDGLHPQKRTLSINDREIVTFTYSEHWCKRQAIIVNRMCYKTSVKSNNCTC